MDDIAIADLRLRIFRNFIRVGHLEGIYAGIRSQKQGRPAVQTGDILRAAVVLLHATLEELLRTVERYCLPQADPKVLETVLVPTSPGEASPTSPSKFTVAALQSHRDRSVNSLISEAIDTHLARRTYNNTTDLVNAISRCGLDKKAIEVLLPALDSLIQRRHDIVHRGDMNTRRGSGQHYAQSISPRQLHLWSVAVEDLAEALLKELAAAKSNEQP